MSRWGHSAKRACPLHSGPEAQSSFYKLIAPSSRDTLVIDLAMDFRFSSDNTFVRAFRRLFGLTPGEVRQLAASYTKAGPIASDLGVWPWILLKIEAGFFFDLETLGTSQPLRFGYGKKPGVQTPYAIGEA